MQQARVKLVAPASLEQSRIPNVSKRPIELFLFESCLCGQSSVLRQVDSVRLTKRVLLVCADSINGQLNGGDDDRWASAGGKN